MTEETYWAVCRTFSFRVHRVAPEIEKINHPTFVPTYVRTWVSGGKLSSRERVLFPGYALFQTTDHDWSDVASMDGVDGVLASAGRAGRVTEAEFLRLFLGHARREFDVIDRDVADHGPRKNRRRRRARPGRRLRTAERAAA